MNSNFSDQLASLVDRERMAAKGDADRTADLFTETLRGCETSIGTSHINGVAVYWASAVELLPNGRFRTAIHNDGPHATSERARKAIDSRRAVGDRSLPIKSACVPDQSKNEGP